MNPYIGTILMVGFNFAPVGWAMCDGQLLQISQNQALFSLLGTTYGGDGIHTFALPDLRGRMPIGMGQGTGLPNYQFGQSGAIGGPTAVAPQVAADHFLALNFIIALNGVFPSRGYGGGRGPHPRPRRVGGLACCEGQLKHLGGPVAPKKI